MELVTQQMVRIPQNEQPNELQTLFQQLQNSNFPTWTVPTVTLCRVDCNMLNFVRRPEQWFSVDWENSGWGDPAFEIADLATHVANKEVPETDWQSLIDAYCQLVKDPQCKLRIRCYRKILRVWYIVRLYRYLYEMPRGLDQRLATLPAEWQADIQAKYEHYLKIGELD